VIVKVEVCRFECDDCGQPGSEYGDKWWFDSAEEIRGLIDDGILRSWTTDGDKIYCWHCACTHLGHVQPGVVGQRKDGSRSLFCDRCARTL
jgi:hypothetical protein